MKKLSAFLLAVIFLFSCFNVCAEETNDEVLESVPTAATADEITLNSKSVILVEPQTFSVIYENNADEVLPPASVTKIMSLLLVCEAMERGELSLDTVVTASETASAKGGSQIWLEPGEQMTVDDLLKAVCIVSANDATTALAEEISGSEESFVSLMNKRAAELGMNDTVFKNCTGLDAEGHVTTVHDIAIMSAKLLSYDVIKNYTTVWMDTLRNGESQLVNTNKLVRFYEGTTGLKTGTTSGAGYCLSASAKRDGIELVAVIMGADTSKDRFADAQKLLNYGFANYTLVNITPEIPENTSVPVLNGEVNTVEVESEGNIQLLQKKGESGKITQEITLYENVSAPVTQGEKVGVVSVYSGGEEIGCFEITAVNEVKKLKTSTFLLWILQQLVLF